MITAGELRIGKNIRFEDGIWTVTEFTHVSSENGADFVKVKLKNLITLEVLEKPFRTQDEFTEADIRCKSMHYLFRNGAVYSFMNPESYQQLDIPEEIVGNALWFVKENEECKVCFYEDTPFSVEGPMFAELTVLKTEENEENPEAPKAAIVETGAQVMVPAFVSVGDKIKIDTRTGAYLSRI